MVANYTKVTRVFKERAGKMNIARRWNEAESKKKKRGLRAGEQSEH